MIELTSGYKSIQNQKFLLNHQHICYVSQCDLSKNASYEGVNCIVEYIGSNENNVVYVKETYDKIKELLKCL